MTAPRRTHVLAYVRRKVARRRSAPAGTGEEPEQPVGHAFSQHGLWRRHLAGQALTVWLFGCLRFGPARLPPALDARMLLGAADTSNAQHLTALSRLKSAGLGPNKADFEYALLADPDPAESHFLPWADATELMFDLSFQPTGKRLPGNLRSRISLLPRHFQSSRILTDDAVMRIEAHAASVLARPRVFVSYRWATGTAQAAAAVQALSSRGFAIWWDRWGMSRSVAEGRTAADETTLEKALERACTGCSHALLVASDGYGETHWTRWERERLLRWGGAEKRIELLQL